MKLSLSFALLLATSSMVTALESSAASPAKANAEINGWGMPTDPDGDCKFFVAHDELLITVPGNNGPHDLAAEIKTVNAPRVLQPVRGDFVLQVKIEGRLTPGDESTLPGRTGYNGAGIVLMADPENVICLARAVLHRSGGEPMPYANFEMRSNGKLDRIGYANEHPLPMTGPVFLRLERRGQKIIGAVSADGVKWDVLKSKKIPADWPQKLKVGVVAISTSKEEFNPRFSNLQIVK
ncbi:MAG: prkC 13 [Pedosphaera sp.]|nr:prkC 13 [Pedosphaera sp.]